jgi:YfiH family protein
MASFVWKREPVEHLALEGWAGVRAWMTGRRGGVSPPPFSTLNLSVYVRDLPYAVAENRRRALLPGGPRRAVWARPEHGGRVHAVDGATATIERGDGLVTRDASIVLAHTYADCVPLFLFAPDIGWAGLLHAGWRGTVANIAAAGVAALVSEGADPARMEAGIGPSIGPCCYEVGEDVAALVRGLPRGEEFLLGGFGERPHLDLWGMNRALLEAAGLSADRIIDAELCTSCEVHHFFSHRRERRTGRMGGFLCLETP